MSSEIRIVGMSGNSVDPIPNTKLYRYSFRLSEMPDYDWKLMYEQAAKGGLADGSRRKSTIVDDIITVEMSADDNKQEQLNLQKELVATINRKYTAAQELVARELEVRAQQKQHDEDEIQRLREEVKGLVF